MTKFNLKETNYKNDWIKQKTIFKRFSPFLMITPKNLMQWRLSKRNLKRTEKTTKETLTSSKRKSKRLKIKFLVFLKRKTLWKKNTTNRDSNTKLNRKRSSTLNTSLERKKSFKRTKNGDWREKNKKEPKEHYFQILMKMKLTCLEILQNYFLLDFENTKTKNNKFWKKHRDQQKSPKNQMIFRKKLMPERLSFINELTMLLLLLEAKERRRTKRRKYNTLKR